MKTNYANIAIYAFIIVLISLTSCSNGNNTISKYVNGIKVENSHCNIGKLSTSHDSDDYYQFSFFLLNTTNNRIELDSVEVSCSCLTIEHSPSCLKANGCDSITGYVNIKDLTGQFSKSLYVNFKNGNIMLLRVVGIVE